jgi:hypothetical protein
MKQIKLMAVLLLMSAAMVSCTSDKVNSMTRNISNCFGVVTNNTDGSVYTAIGMSCKLYINLDESTADITLYDFQATSSSSKGSLTLSNIPWNVNTDGSLGIDQSVIANNGNITNFKLVYVNRYIGSYNLPVLRVSFTYSNAYDVVLYQEQYVYVDNSTVVTTIATGTTYSPDPNTQYVVTLNPQTKTASLYIDGAQFAQNMQAVQMTFKDINYEYVTDGYVLNSDSLIPESNSTPYPQYTITSLTGNANLAGPTTIGFTCADTYRVNCTLNYLSTTE